MIINMVFLNVYSKLTRYVHVLYAIPRAEMKTVLIGSIGPHLECNGKEKIVAGDFNMLPFFEFGRRFSC